MYAGGAGLPLGGDLMHRLIRYVPHRRATRRRLPALFSVRSRGSGTVGVTRLENKEVDIGCVSNACF